MTDLSPIPVLWRDGAFVPATQRQAKRCSEQFEDGKRYLLVEHQERSINSHNHYFAQLGEAFDNLPEDIAHEFPTFAKFRATGLISTGFYNQRSILCASEEEARRVASFVAPFDDLAIVSVHGSAVVVRTAKSQSYRAMDKAEFRKSKEAVLAWAWGLVGVDPETGNANAGKAA
jgi:hypothetical protein